MNSHKFTKDLLIFAEVAKFRQIWSHCLEGKASML